MLSASAWFDAAAEVVGRLTGRWVKAGALSAIEYRLAPRPTFDADMLVEWQAELIPTLEGAGYTLRVIRDPQADNPHLIIAKRGEERVDFLIPTVEYQEIALERGVGRHVLTVEDVIIHKLIAWRPKDIDDVVSIVAAGHELDRDYIEYWAVEWEVVDRWREAIRAK